MVCPLLGLSPLLLDRVSFSGSRKSSESFSIDLSSLLQRRNDLSLHFYSALPPFRTPRFSTKVQAGFSGFLPPQEPSSSTVRPFLLLPSSSTLRPPACLEHVAPTLFTEIGAELKEKKLTLFLLCISLFSPSLPRSASPSRTTPFSTFILQNAWCS